MRPLIERLALVGATAAIGIVAATSAGAGNDELAHATHNVPGNTSIAYPLADGVRRVGGDNTSTGGHVVEESGRLYVGAYGLGMRIFDLDGNGPYSAEQFAAESDGPRWNWVATPGCR